LLLHGGGSVAPEQQLLLNPAMRQGTEAAVSRQADRLRSAYHARTAEGCYPESVAGRFQFEERERHVLRLLERYDLLPLAGRKILEVGCGTGKWLRDLIAWGADPHALVGVELLEASAVRARRLCPPGVTIEPGNAALLSHPSGSFDIVLQASLFTSVLDDDMRRSIAAEMLRVLRPNGIIVWYDLFLNTQGSSYLRPVTKEELRHLFPGCVVDVRRVSLSPVLTQLLAPRSWSASTLLSRLAPLCTHYLGAIRRPPMWS
jgi:SAM-dependent methyltransferase